MRKKIAGHQVYSLIKSINDEYYLITGESYKKCKDQKNLFKVFTSMNVRIEDYMVGQTYNGHYYLLGYVYNHPKWANGKYIQTTNIIKYVDNMVYTKNNSYELGSESNYNLVKLKDIKDFRME